MTNEELLQAERPQLQGQLRVWWPRLTDEDVDTWNGESETLIEALRKRYGYGRERAEQEVESRLRHYEDEFSGLMRK